MKYNELVLSKQKTARRSGRGISGGHGKTAGRGTKGQGSRKSPVRYGFEGGQNPLYARLPKLRGFKSHRRISEVIYTSQLNDIKSAKLDNKAVHEAGLTSSPYVAVKVVLKGEITAKKDIHLQSASKNAIVAIEKAGGAFHVTNQPGRPVTSAKKTAKAAKE
jgi:large subunit ribosomal protein L15